MKEQIRNLLERVERRVPKLIDQMALAEIREALQLADADKEVELTCERCGKRVYLIENWEVVDTEPIEVELCPCHVEAADETVRDILTTLAGKTNDPELLEIISKGLNK